MPFSLSPLSPFVSPTPIATVVRILSATIEVDFHGDVRVDFLFDVSMCFCFGFHCLFLLVIVFVSAFWFDRFLHFFAIPAFPSFLSASNYLPPLLFPPGQSSFVFYIMSSRFLFWGEISIFDLV